MDVQTTVLPILTLAFGLVFGSQISAFVASTALAQCISLAVAGSLIGGAVLFDIYMQRQPKLKKASDKGPFLNGKLAKVPLNGKPKSIPDIRLERRATGDTLRSDNSAPGSAEVTKKKAEKFAPLAEQSERPNEAEPSTGSLDLEAETSSEFSGDPSLRLSKTMKDEDGFQFTYQNGDYVHQEESEKTPDPRSVTEENKFSASRHSVPPTFPLSLRDLTHPNKIELQPNSRKPILVENEVFKGYLVTKLRTEPCDLFYEPYFRGRKRWFEVQLQGRFKQKPEGTLYMGVELPREPNLGIIGRSLAKILLNMMKRLLKNFRYSFGDDKTDTLPHVVLPVTTLADRFLVTKPGEVPPPLCVSMLPEEDPADLKKRKAHGLELNCEETYSFSFHAMYLDFVKWRIVNIPGMKEISLQTFCGDMPIRIVAYDLPNGEVSGRAHQQDEKRYYFSLNMSWSGADEQIDWPDSPAHELKSSSEVDVSLADRRHVGDSLDTSPSGLAVRKSSRRGKHRRENSTGTESIRVLDDDESEIEDEGSSRRVRPDDDVVEADDDDDEDEDFVDVDEGMFGATNTPSGRTVTPLIAPRSGVPDPQGTLYKMGVRYIAVPAWVEMRHRHQERSVSYAVEIVFDNRAFTAICSSHQIVKMMSRISSKAALDPALADAPDADMSEASNISLTSGLKDGSGIKEARKKSRSQQLIDEDRSSAGGANRSTRGSRSRGQSLGSEKGPDHPSTAVKYVGVSRMRSFSEIFNPSSRKLVTRLRKTQDNIKDIERQRKNIQKYIRESFQLADGSEENTTHLLNAVLSCNDDESASIFLHGTRAEFKVTNRSKHKVLVECPVARSMWETYWREEWMLILDNRVCLYRSNTSKPYREFYPEEIVSVGPFSQETLPFGVGSFLEIGTIGKIFYFAVKDDETRDKIIEIVADLMPPGDKMSLVDADFYRGSDPREFYLQKSSRYGSSRVLLNSRRLWFGPRSSDEPKLLVQKLLRQGMVLRVDSPRENILAFLDATARLKGVHLNVSWTEAEKMSFYLNLYHLLLVHALLLLGPPSSSVSRITFYTKVCYEVGSFYYSLSEIEQGCLRNAMPPPKALFSHMVPGFPENDHRKRFACFEGDPRIAIALHCNIRGGTRVQRIPVYEANNVSEQVDELCGRYLQAMVKVNESRRSLHLPKPMEWYMNDYSGRDDLLMFVARYINDARAITIRRMIESGGDIRLKFDPFDWSYQFFE
eukprot:Clim_evm123s134 gene=Clim_evmTU123s134